MKIKIAAQEVKVDVEKWAIDFGIEAKDVRKDVQAYFADWFQQQVIQLGLQEDDK